MSGPDTRDEAYLADEGPLDDQAVIASFLARYLEDRLQGQVADLAHYQQLFPKHAELIRREHETLHGASQNGEEQAASFGRYEQLEEIGRGGQGVVYSAVDRRLGRRVALKILNRSARLSGPLDRERFLREARVASRLDHPNLCALYEAGESEGQFYLAMRFLSGETLAARIRREHQSPVGTQPRVPSEPHLKATLRLFETLANALHYAHETGVIHRDIKPANIMILPSAEPVLMDFGIARTHSEEQVTLTGTEDLIGTPAYLAPELIEDPKRHADVRTDVYALGVSLYEAVTGTRPFEAPTRERLYRAIRCGQAIDAGRLVKGLPRDLAAVIATAMDRDPQRRYASASALAEDLRRVLEHRPVSARPAGPMLRLLRWWQRERVLATSLATIVLISLSAAFIALRAQHKTSAALEERSIALQSATFAKNAAEEHLSAWRRLSDLQRAQELEERAQRLWPAEPELLPAMDDWIAECEELLARKASHQSEWDRLQRRAIAIPVAEREEQLKAHPRAREYADLRHWIQTIEDKFLNQPDEKIKEVVASDYQAAIRLREDIEADFALLPKQRFENPEDRWRIALLEDLLKRLDHLGSGARDSGPELRARRMRAAGLQALTIEAPRDEWANASERVALNPAYEGASFAPQLGLIPLGPDLNSGLEEFALAHTGVIPHRDPETQRLAIDGESAMVFVLLPGGMATIGLQNEDPSAPHFDRFAHMTELRVHEVQLSPFLLSKYEMTQGQWQRATGDNPSSYGVGSRFGTETPVDFAHPVENISWADAERVLRTLGLRLPSEAQWEYAARAGTTTLWWVGDRMRDLEGAANLADESCRLAGGPEGLSYLRWKDGWPVHAPVGSYRANAFGLFDVIGNVNEWCQDTMGLYRFPVEEGTGLRKVPGVGYRITRGGDFHSPPQLGQSGRRNALAPESRNANVGVRPARDFRSAPTDNATR